MAEMDSEPDLSTPAGVPGERTLTYGVKLYGQFETAPGGTSREAADAYARENDAIVYESEDGGRTWFPAQVRQSAQWLNDEGLLD